MMGAMYLHMAPRKLQLSLIFLSKAKQSKANKFFTKVHSLYALEIT